MVTRAVCSDPQGGCVRWNQWYMATDTHACVTPWGCWLGESRTCSLFCRPHGRGIGPKHFRRHGELNEIQRVPPLSFPGGESLSWEKLESTTQVTCLEGPSCDAACSESLRESLGFEPCFKWSKSSLFATQRCCIQMPHRCPLMPQWNTCDSLASLGVYDVIQ